MLRRRMMMAKQAPPSPSYPTDGLVAEYLFEGNLNDTSTNAHTATGVGVLGYVTGKVGQALDLNRTSSTLAYVDVGDIATLDGKSFSLWFKRGTGYGAGSSFNAFRQGTSTLFVEIAATLVRVNGYSGGTYNWTWTGGVATSDTNWHHFALVWESASIMNVWLDGVKLTKASGSTTFPQGALSMFRYLGIAASSAMNVGYFDQYRIYNRALTDAEIAQLYNNGQGV